MVVDTKAKTETLKTGKASYYPLTIIAKTFKAPIYRYKATATRGVLDAEITTTMPKDAKGKLYVSGGDVDVSMAVGI